MPSYRLIARLSAGLALAGACFGVAATKAQAQTETPRTASAFIDSIGVNIHAAAWASAYGNVREFEERLEQLGVRHVRDAIWPGLPWQYAIFNRLAEHGITLTALAGAQNYSQVREIVEKELAPDVDAIEGPNEYDNSGYENWAEILRSTQASIWTLFKSYPTTKNIPILAPALANSDLLGMLGNVSASFDFDNFHPYPGGDPPERGIGKFIADGERYSGGKPLVATETGYDNALASVAGNLPVPETVAAVYIPRIFLDYFRRGIARTFLYELVDEKPDKTNSIQGDSFGLLRNDWTPKPAFESLRNLIFLLGDAGPLEASTKPVTFSLRGETTRVEHLILQKADGSKEIVLWQTASIWNRVAKASFPTQTQHVSLSIEGSSAEATLARPLISASREPADIEKNVIQVGVPADPVVIEIPPESSGAQSPPSQSEPSPAEPSPTEPSPVEPAPGEASSESPSEPSAASSEEGKGVSTRGATEVDPLVSPTAGVRDAPLVPFPSASPLARENLGASSRTAASEASLQRFLAALRRSLTHAVQRSSNLRVFMVPVIDPQAGHVTVTLAAVAGAGAARKAGVGHSSRLGGANARFDAHSKVSLVIRLNAHAHRLLSLRKISVISMHITFAPRGQRRVSTSARIKL